MTIQVLQKPPVVERPQLKLMADPILCVSGTIRRGQWALKSVESVLSHPETRKEAGCPFDVDDRAEGDAARWPWLGVD